MIINLKHDNNDNIPLTVETMRKLVDKPWRRSPEPWCRKKIRKIEKTKKRKNF